MPHTGDVHVVPKGDRWAVEVEGNGASSTHDTQEDAISAGRRIAQQNRTELLIHGEDGQIRERSTYGADPRSTKG
jgi:Uncharacterized protein conserved in bacteria (DUF2188)